MGEGETHKRQVGKPQTLAGSLPLRYRPWRLPLGEGRTASFMPENPSTAVAPHERLHQAEGLKVLIKRRSKNPKNILYCQFGTEGRSRSTELV
ncbi:hypothetical protein [Nostoc sp.]|uniref:hypothetical protein n=1 Tax=Nostoc sp. TaxID=1180 RepID=UPI002FF59B18